MLTLIRQIRDRLIQGAYVNEAAISHGIVTPLINALGWDSADPEQLVPEYSIPHGRVDFALFGLGHRPAVFIEVKQVGRAVEGDRQLFEYAFHAGVPICVLTDGREWSFYLPSGQGSYEERRIYRLQLDDREPAECERILTRYLARDRVRDGRAFDDALRDYRDVAGLREATSAVPRAWHDLLAQPEELLLDIVGDRAEALCGLKPAQRDVLDYLRRLTGIKPITTKSISLGEPPATFGSYPASTAPKTAVSAPTASVGTRQPIQFTMLGRQYDCANASEALVEVLRTLAERDPGRIQTLADIIRTTKRSLIAHKPAEVNPGRPHLARAAQFAPDWVIGLNISNREKLAILRAACSVFDLRMPEDLAIEMPNSGR